MKPVSCRTELTADGRYRLMLRYKGGMERSFGIWESESAALSKAFYFMDEKEAPRLEDQYCEVHERIHPMEEGGHWQTWNGGLRSAHRNWITVWICPEYEASLLRAEARS